MGLHEGVADLHVHTTASDGTATVDERVSDAQKQGLDVVAITDHDTIPSELHERRKTVSGIELVTGFEVRADLFDIKIEILNYYVDPSDDGVQSLLERVQEYRRDRNRRLVENVHRRRDSTRVTRN